MGYTHYWTQRRSFTPEAWQEATDDIREILTYVEHSVGVPLADGEGTPRTRPVFGPDTIIFNGLGDDAHETFVLTRKRPKDGEFCKTSRKPYDLAVTACLCYLSTVSQTHDVVSDGNGSDFVAGLEAARQALPRKANILDIPMPIMEDDRWTGPWVKGNRRYQVRFCINGKGYVIDNRSCESYCFATHDELGQFLASKRHVQFRRGGSTVFGRYDAVEPDIWDATGSFDKARLERIGRAQMRVLATLFPVIDAERAEPPPAYVRPGEMPRPDDDAFCYSLNDLLKRLPA